MRQHQKLVSLLCLLFLAVGLPASHAEVFPQCANVEADTFVMAVDDCTSYIYCNAENSFRDSCPDQTYFDANAQECAFDDSGVCLQPTESTTIQDTSVAPAASDTPIEGLVTATGTTGVPAATAEDGQQATENQPAPTGTRPHCDATGDGYHPHPQRCEYYYSCIGGYLTIVRCPYNYGWDYTQQQCKPLSESQCFSL